MSSRVKQPTKKRLKIMQLHLHKKSNFRIKRKLKPIQQLSQIFSSFSSRRSLRGLQISSLSTSQAVVDRKSKEVVTDEESAVHRLNEKDLAEGMRVVFISLKHITRL